MATKKPPTKKPPTKKAPAKKKQPGPGELLATLGKTSTEKGNLFVRCEFDLSATAIIFLVKTRNWHVGLKEPDRGQVKDPTYEFTGMLRDVVIPRAPKKTGHFVLRFDDRLDVHKALYQVRQRDPATILIFQSQMALDLHDGEEPPENPNQTELKFPE